MGASTGLSGFVSFGFLNLPFANNTREIIPATTHKAIKGITIHLIYHLPFEGILVSISKAIILLNILQIKNFVIKEFKNKTFFKFINKMKLETKPDTITIYSKEGCSYCTKAKELLDMNKIPFDLIKLEPTSEDYLIKLNFIKEDSDSNTFPFIYIGDKFFGGFTELNNSLNTNLSTKLKKIGINFEPFAILDF